MPRACQAPFGVPPPQRETRKKQLPLARAHTRQTRTPTSDWHRTECALKTESCTRPPAPPRHRLETSRAPPRNKNHKRACGRQKRTPFEEEEEEEEEEEKKTQTHSLILTQSTKAKPCSVGRCSRSGWQLSRGCALWPSCKS